MALPPPPPQWDPRARCSLGLPSLTGMCCLQAVCKSGKRGSHASLAPVATGDRGALHLQSALDNVAFVWDRRGDRNPQDLRYFIGVRVVLASVAIQNESNAALNT